LWREEKRNPRYCMVLTQLSSSTHGLSREITAYGSPKGNHASGSTPNFLLAHFFFFSTPRTAEVLTDPSAAKFPAPKKSPSVSAMNDSGKSLFPRQHRPRESSGTRTGLRSRAFRPYQWKLRSRKIQLLQPASHGKWRERNERRCCFE
jgi:hypothetical protein